MSFRKTGMSVRLATGPSLDWLAGRFPRLGPEQAA